MPKVLLKVTHTHAGEIYFAGSTLDVDDQTADWIVRHQIGELVKEDSQPADVVAKNKKTVSKKRRKE